MVEGEYVTSFIRDSINHQELYSFLSLQYPDERFLPYLYSFTLRGRAPFFLGFTSKMRKKKLMQKKATREHEFFFLIFLLLQSSAGIQRWERKKQQRKFKSYFPRILFYIGIRFFFMRLNKQALDFVVVVVAMCFSFAIQILLVCILDLILSFGLSLWYELLHFYASFRLIIWAQASEYRIFGKRNLSYKL